MNCFQNKIVTINYTILGPKSHTSIDVHNIKTDKQESVLTELYMSSL